MRLNDNVISMRIAGFYGRHPSQGSRRQLAKNLITPGADLPEYSRKEMVYFQLAAYWALRKNEQRILKAGQLLWNLPPNAANYAGQLALVFRYGNPDSVKSLRAGANTYLSFTVGRLPAEPAPLHSFSGKAASNAQPSAEGVKAPYLRGTVSLPLLEGLRAGLDAEEVVINPAANNDIGPTVYETIAHIGEDAVYAGESISTETHQTLLGNVAVRGFIAGLPDYARAELLPSINSISTAA